MIPMRHFNPHTVLLWWSKMPSKDKVDIHYVIKMAQLNQVDEQDLTVPKVRRYIKKQLRRFKLIPLDRPPTDHDYQVAKARWQTYWYDQDIN